MFYGEFEHSLDRKNRIIIPAKFREALKDSFIEKFYITRGLDGCLFIFTEEEWKKQEQKFKSLSFTSPEARTNPFFFSPGADCGQLPCFGDFCKSLPVQPLRAKKVDFRI